MATDSVGGAPQSGDASAFAGWRPVESTGSSPGIYKGLSERPEWVATFKRTRDRDAVMALVRRSASEAAAADAPMWMRTIKKAAELNDAFAASDTAGPRLHAQAAEMKKRIELARAALTAATPAKGDART